MPSTTDVQSTNTHTKIRLLLTLWDLGGAQKEVPTGQLTKRVVPKGSKKADFQALFDELQAEGAIEIAKKGYSMPALGLQMLNDSLKSPDFHFGSQVGAKTANALLKWIREGGTLGDGAASAASLKGVESAIASYDEFKQVALDVYDKLNRDYNLDDLVPIYRIRREIGEKVTRSKFNEWMLEMQENDILQLIGGELTDITPDKAEDSIKTELGAIRYYVKRLSSKN
ncbi:hypothetical protein [Argonema galeatum]|uniref:hypothetical protein n=1 Tax=Argonema galeatum TaxID=2942762 RepID=UPI0020115AB9|nr:hypothetical protein [Argonema galeatum]MCL1463904.1 hypothetical protein [Argonema galeatum A003/A1]